MRAIILSVAVSLVTPNWVLDARAQTFASLPLSCQYNAFECSPDELLVRQRLALRAEVEPKWHFRPVARATPRPSTNAGRAPSAQSTNSDTTEDQGRLMVGAGRDGRFRIPAQLNGVTSEFVVDTGATDVLLPLKVARKAGIDTERLRYTVPIRTASGQTTVARAMLEELQIAGRSFRDVQVLVAREKDRPSSLLGMSVLSQLTAVSISEGFLRVTP